MTDQGVTFINAIEPPAEQVDEFIEQWRERVALIRTAPAPVTSARTSCPSG
ncbi:hypothetical protein [Nocardia thraciensis]